MPNDIWDFDPAGPEEPSPGRDLWDFNAGVSDSFTPSLREEWEDYGIFERNTITGELRLRKKIGALGGLSTDILGHSMMKITDDPDMVMDDHELLNMNRSYDEGFLSWFGFGEQSRARIGAQYPISTAVGLHAMNQDITATGLDWLGFDKAAEVGREAATETRDLRSLWGEQVQELSPPTLIGPEESYNPVKDLWRESMDWLKDPSLEDAEEVWKKYTSFVTTTAAPLVLAQMLKFVPGVGWIKAAKDVKTGVDISSAAIQGLYGAMGLESGYDEVRYNDDGSYDHSMPVALTAGWTSAALSGYLEDRGFRGIWKNTGGSWIRGVGNAFGSEAKTEAAQDVTTKLLTDLPDFATDYIFNPERDLTTKQVREYTGQLAETGWWAGVGGGLVGGTIRGLTPSGFVNEKDNSGMKSLADLGTVEREQVLTHMGELKMFLEAASANALHWSPAHEAAVNAISAKWGKVQEVTDTLAAVKRLRSDPILAGKEQALLDRATGVGVDPSLQTLTPEQQAWEILRTSQVPANKAMALTQWLSSRTTVSPLEARVISDTADSTNVGSLTPSDAELYLNSLIQTRDSTAAPESKARVQESIDTLQGKLSQARETPEAQAVSSSWERLANYVLNQELTGMPFIETVSALVSDVAGKASQVGYWATNEAQEAIMRIQNRLSEEMIRDTESGPAEASARIQAGAQAVLKLNAWLSPANTAMSQENYVDPLQSLIAMKGEIDNHANSVVEEKAKIEAALRTADPTQVQTGSLGTSRNVLISGSYAIVSVKPEWMSEGLHARVKSQVDTPTQNEAEIGQIVQEIEDQANQSMEQVGREILSKYRKAAQEQAAKGVDGDPITFFMAQEDEATITEKKRAVSQNQSLIKDTKKKIYDLFKFSKKDKDVKDLKGLHELNNLIDNITEELGTGYTKDHPAGEMVKEEAIELVAGQLNHLLFHAAIDSGRLGRTAAEHAVNLINEWLLLTNLLKPWDVNPNKPAQQSALREWARLKGIPTTEPGWSQGEGARKAAASREAAKLAMQRGEYFNLAEARLIWRTLNMDQVFEIRQFLEEGHTPFINKSPRGKEGEKIVSRLAWRLASQNPRGLPLDVRSTDLANASPTLMAGVSDSFRAANVLKRLFSAHSVSLAEGKSTKETEALLPVSFKSVIHSLLGLRGSLAKRTNKLRFDYERLRNQLKDLMPEIEQDNQPGLVDPSTELGAASSSGDVELDVFNQGEQEWDDAVNSEGELILDEDGEPQTRPVKTRARVRRVLTKADVERRRRAWEASRPLRMEVQEAVEKWLAAREKELVLFYEVMKSTGYQFKDQAEIDRILTQVVSTDEKRQTLQYLSRINESVKRAVAQGSTPSGLSLALKNNGYTNEEISMVIALVDSMANKFHRQTGKAKMEFWSAAARTITGYDRKTQQVLKKDSLDNTHGYHIIMAGLVGTAFKRLRSRLVVFAKRALDPAGGASIFTPVHELLHGLLDSGYFAELLTKEERKLVEGWLGEKLNRVVNGQVVGVMNSDAQERLISSIEGAISISDLGRGSTLVERAFREIRRNLFSLASRALGTGDVASVTYSGVNLLDLQLPEDIRHTLLSIFDVNSKVPSIYNLTTNGIVITAAHKLAGMVSATTGVDISTFLHRKFDDLGKALNEESTLRTILRVAASKVIRPHKFENDVKSFEDFTTLMGLHSNAPPVIKEHLKVIYESLREDAELLNEWSYIPYMKAKPSYDPAYLKARYRENAKIEKAVGDLKKLGITEEGAEIIASQIPHLLKTLGLEYAREKGIDPPTAPMIPPDLLWDINFVGHVPPTISPDQLQASVQQVVNEFYSEATPLDPHGVPMYPALFQPSMTDIPRGRYNVFTTAFLDQFATNSSHLQNRFFVDVANAFQTSPQEAAELIDAFIHSSSRYKAPFKSEVFRDPDGGVTIPSWMGQDPQQGDLPVIFEHPSSEAAVRFKEELLQNLANVRESVQAQAVQARTEQSAKVAEQVMHTTTPLAFEDSKSITEPLMRLLGTYRPPLLTGNKNITSKNGQNLAVRALSMAMDLGNLFHTQHHALEKLLLRQGLTREYLMTMNMGGLYAQAKGQIENKVTVLEGALGLGREKWRIINESLRDIVHEIPDEMQDDVWGYLRAKRELELVKNNKRDLAEYEKKMLAHAADPTLPTPKEPDIPDIDPDMAAAALVLATALEAKWGKDGGKVGEYASRIVKFENAAIAYKLYHYGMLSEKEYKALLDKGEWWIPYAVTSGLAKKFEHIEPYYNDGTKAALNNLKTDLEGIAHPYQEIVRRVMSVHMMTQRQWVRTALLKSMITDSNGQRHSDEDLEKLGIVPLYTEISQPVATLDEWLASKNRVPVRTLDSGEKIYNIKVRVPLNRSGYEEWTKTGNNINKKDKVYAIWENGQASYYLVEDSHLRSAIDSLKITQLPTALRVIAKMTALFAGLITHNPKFIAFMMLKDYGNAVTRSRAGLNPVTLIPDLAIGLFQSLPYMFPSLARRFPKTYWAYNDRVHSLANQSSFAESISPTGAKLSGGGNAKKGTSTFRSMVDDIVAVYKESNETKQLRNRHQHDNGLKKIWRGVKKGVMGTVEELRRVAAMFDAAFRMRERMLLKQGNLGTLDYIRNMRTRLSRDSKSPLDNRELNAPGYMSDLFVDAMDRQLTLDFARKGSLVRVWAMMKMFAGPMFQDTLTTRQRLADPIGRKSFIVKGVLTMTLPVLMSWAMWHDDDDWQRLPYWDKFNYFQWNKRDDGTFSQIPAPIGLAAIVFKDLPLALAQMISEDDPLAALEFGRQVTEQTPLQYLPVGQNTKDWVSHVTPTLAEGSIETAINWNPLSNTPIDYDVGKQQAELPEDRGVEKSGIIEAILARALDTSPRLVSYWMKQHTPGAAQIFYRAGNMAATEAYHAAGGDPRVGSQYGDLPSTIWKANSGQIYGPASLPVNRFYEIYVEARNAKESIEQAYELDAVDRAMSLEKEYPQWEYADYFKSVYGDIQQLKIQRGIFMKENAADIDSVRVEIREAFDKPMTLLAEEALREYYHLVNTTYNK